MFLIVGLFILWSTINFSGWFVLGMTEFSFKQCLKYALCTEVFLLGLGIGTYLITGGM